MFRASCCVFHLDEGIVHVQSRAGETLQRIVNGVYFYRWMTSLEILMENSIVPAKPSNPQKHTSAQPPATQIKIPLQAHVYFDVSKTILPAIAPFSIM